jgi:hypothetical protein
MHARPKLRNAASPARQGEGATISGRAEAVAEAAHAGLVMLG